MNTLTTRIAPFLFLLVPAVQANSQEMVKVNIVELYDKVPGPPADVRGAFARAECTGQGVMVNCNTKKFFAPTEEEVDAIARQISRVSMTLGQPAVDATKNMNPEEMKKKLASMSKAEQIKYAMEISKQMGLSKALAPEPAAVTAALEESARLNEQLAADVQNITEITKKKVMLREQRDNKHNEIGEWEGTEAKKIPLVDGGEAGRFPDPKLSHALRVKAMDRHVAAENEYLKALSAAWSGQLKSEKLRYSPLQQKLAAVHYGEDAKNNETKQRIVNAQGLLLGPIIELESISKEATDSAVQWWRQKLGVDARKPQE